MFNTGVHGLLGTRPIGRHRMDSKPVGKTPPEQSIAFFILKSDNVCHAGLVLEIPIYAVDAKEDEKPLEEAHSKLPEMMSSISEFERK